MRVLSRTSDGLKRCYNVQITLEDLNEDKAKELQDLRKEVKMDGFRPGKVPMKIIERKYGQLVDTEVRKDAVNRYAKRVLADENLKISFNYETESVKENDEGIEFTLKFEVVPTVELKDFSKIELVKHVSVPSEEEIDNLIEGIRKGTTNWKEITEEVDVKEGHTIEVDLKVKYKNGGGSDSEGRSIENQRILVGDKSLIDDFWKYFVGARIGDIIEFDVSYPEDMAEKQLAGKVFHYVANVKKVFEAGEFELNDEFATSLGYENLADLKDKVRKREEFRRGRISAEVLKRNLIDKISEMYDFEVPSNMVKIEKNEVVKQIKEEALRLGKEFTEEIEKECDKLAVDRVRLGFVIAEFAKENKINVTKNEVVSAIKLFAASDPERSESILNMYKNNPERINDIAGPLLESKVLDFIIEHMSIKEENCTLKELIDLDEEVFDFFKDEESGKAKSKSEGESEKDTDSKAKTKKSTAKKNVEDKKEESSEEPKKKTPKKRIVRKAD